MAITVLAMWDYYDGAYKNAMGSTTIPQASFGKYSIKASNEIRKRTFGRPLPVIDQVQMCMCELAEHYYLCDQRDDGNNGIASEKDGSWSVTYESSEKLKESDSKEVVTIINNWLLGTGLLYCGV